MIELPTNSLICSADILLACISTSREHVLDFQVFHFRFNTVSGLSACRIDGHIGIGGDFCSLRSFFTGMTAKLKCENGELGMFLRIFCACMLSTHYTPVLTCFCSTEDDGSPVLLLKR